MRMKGKPVHPGRIVVQRLAKMGINQADFARHLGIVPQNISYLAVGQRRITVTLAVRLAAAFENSPEYWLDLQRDYDLSKMAACEVGHLAESKYAK